MAKAVTTIAQMAIMNWVESHLGVCNVNVKFTDKREAYVTDANGDGITLVYDNVAGEVYIS